MTFCISPLLLHLGRKYLTLQRCAQQVGAYFQLKERGSNFTTEMRAGTATFLTVSTSSL